ncbi:MAG TPA: hypothetical protein VGB20_07330 [bacterium]
MTLTLTEFLLIVIAVSAVVACAVLVRLASQMGRSAQEIERLARWLSMKRPETERLLGDAEHGLAELRITVQRLDRIAENVQGITGGARRLTSPLIAQVAAVAAGAKMAYDTFHRRRSGNHRGTAEPEEESHEQNQ